MILDRGRCAPGARLLQALLVAICWLPLAAAPLCASDAPVKTDASKIVTPGTPSKPAAKAGAHRQKPAPKAVAKAQPLPAQELPPLPAWLMNEAPVKPRVTLADGLLTIDAPNSTLSDVLKGVQTATGATFDGPTPTERVAIHLGPGHPDQVLTALLKGTPYDYIILGETGHPDVISRIVLNPAGPEAAEGKGKAAPMATEPVRIQPAVKPADDAADEQAEESAAPEEALPHDVKPMSPELTQPAPKDASTPADTPKSVEQIYQELKSKTLPQPQTQPPPQ